jgi:hypothetical protein
MKKRWLLPQPPVQRIELRTIPNKWLSNDIDMGLSSLAVVYKNKAPIADRGFIL